MQTVEVRCTVTAVAVFFVESNHVRQRQLVMLAELVGASYGSTYLLQGQSTPLVINDIVELNRHERRVGATFLVIFELQA